MMTPDLNFEMYFSTSENRFAQKSKQQHLSVKDRFNVRFQRVFSTSVFNERFQLAFTVFCCVFKENTLFCRKRVQLKSELNDKKQIALKEKGVNLSAIFRSFYFGVVHK